jgi:hypothetical protein
MPKKPRQNDAQTPKNDVTMLQCVPKKRRGGDNAKTSTTRAKFLHAFEQSFGNISASCEFAGISRPTYYRWMQSNTRVNLRFQQQIERILPGERKLDYMEGKLMQRVEAGDTTAIIFGLKTLGRERGYSERPKEDLSGEELILAQLKNAEELANYLRLFGDEIKPAIREELASKAVN